MSKTRFDNKPTTMRSNFKVPTLPNDPTRPKPIGNLSSFQRQLAEEEVGSTIDNKGFDDNFFEFENGQEYWIFDKQEDAEKKALEQENDLLDSEPSIATDIADRFPEEGFLFITPTDRNALANDLAENRSEGISDQLREDLVGDVEDQIQNEIEKNPKRFGLTSKDVEDESAEWRDVFDKESDEELEKQIDEKLEEKRDEVFREIEKKLEDDPVDFLVEEEGLFTKEDLPKQNFIRLSVEKIAQFVIDTDGVAPTLASYDGDEKFVEKKGVELYMYRAN
jgi:hypothetical protein